MNSDKSSCAMHVVTILLLLLILAGCNRSDQETASHAATDPTSQELMGQSVVSFPDDGLVNQNGDPVAFESLPDKPTLISFIYTRCPMKNMCPMITQKMHAVQKRLGTSGGYPAHFVSITLDPQYDTPKVLKEYGISRSINYDNWDFWTGDPQTIRELMDHFSITAGKQTNGVIGHNMRTYVLDGNHQIQYVYRRSDWPIEEVVRVLRRLVQ